MIISIFIFLNINNLYYFFLCRKSPAYSFLGQSLAFEKS